MRRILTWVSILVTLLVAGRAMADLTYTQGVGTTLFDFVCFTTKHCPVHVNVDSTGTEKFTSGNPGNVAAAASSYAAGAGVDGWDLTQGAKADAAWVSGSGSLIAIAKAIAGNTGAAIPAGTANIGNVGQISQYPTGATAITASATGTTGATTATLAGTGGKTTFICGYSIRANATAATTVTNTITGTITATLSSIMWVAPAASGIGVDEMVFSPCIPASATNTGIAIVSGAPGTGGNVSSKGWGYQL